MRLTPDQSGLIRRAEKVTFTFDGASVAGHAGESLAVALLRAGHLHLRDAPEDGAPRGAFCCMGLCQECVVRIGGQVVESCRSVVASGLAVTSLKEQQ
ncbi:(2Fe-2S)-binding protein [uncultured Roseovarius sp.]|uniref:(2Fe-2S)-binding protein n=1 Tax=uncultured Roseovarius sp. TaxID=293344 RepID=UPI0026161053|nr:(2Fe-2S)-binding protein [uncultured Roseovarius sp.]